MALTRQDTTSEVLPGPEVEDFANALDVCMSRDTDQRQYVLDLPRKFYEITTRRIAELRSNSAHDGDDMDMDVDDADATPDSEELEHLKKEAQTWDLLRRLMPLRYSRDPKTACSSAPPRAPNDFVREFWETDSTAQERRAVLQWLQTNARTGPSIDELVQELQQSADRGDIIAHGWLHTRSAIKLRKSVTAWPHLLDRQSSSISTSHVNTDGAPLVTQLDPDAITRQGRKLEPQDEYFERAIWLGCFQHLRRGSSYDEIRDWSQERTEMWRAISMSATLFPSDENEKITETDPNALALWRRMCYSLARQGGGDDYERAVYGVLSGDLATVEKVAATWDDLLFAHYNALLRTQLDNFLLGQCAPDSAASLTQTFPVFDAVQFHGDPREADKRIVKSLENNTTVAREAAEPIKALQAAFISRDIRSHLESQGLALVEGKDIHRPPLFTSALGKPTNSQRFFSESQHSGIRMMAHIYLITAMLEKLDNETDEGLSLRSNKGVRGDWAQENIVAAYTEYLRRAQLKELIPLYCSILEPMRCYEVLSKSVLQEDVFDQRMEQLRLIFKTGINVNTFVKVQASMKYNELPKPATPSQSRAAQFRIVLNESLSPRYGRAIKPDFFNEEETLPETHDHVIKALEWLLLVEATWADAFSVGVDVYKYFLTNMHLGAARAVMEKVSFSAIINHMVAQEGFDEALLESVDYWAQQLEDSGITDISPQKVMHDARVFRDLEALVKALDNLETVASMEQLSTENPSLTRDFWDTVGEAIGQVKENMRHLLQNWLLPAIEEGDEELKELRKTFLTETVLAYVSALHFGGVRLSRDNLLECMDLASTVAERSSDLAQSFVEAKRMRELVEAFAGVSKALAISKADSRKTASAGSKKLRDLGWSRDIWTVKS